MTSPSRFRTLSFALFGFLTLFILTTFKQYGVSNDELVQHVYGRLLLTFYRSDFVNLSAFHYKNLYLYGGLFDLIAALLEKHTPLWVWDLRHLISALFGLLGMVGAYRTAKLLGGERAGFIAVLLLSLTGAWIGAVFTHTKDIPFASCMIWALFYTIRVVNTLSQPQLADILKLGTFIGLSFGLRVGAGFEVIYLLLSIVISAWLSPAGTQSRLQLLAGVSLKLMLAAIVALIWMAIAWPWSVLAPNHLLEAVKAFAHFEFNMYTVLNGQFITIDNVPRSYLMIYLGLRLPLVLLIGLMASAYALGHAFSQRTIHRAQAAQWAPLIIAIIFPLIFVCIDRPVLYNGIRHFTFLLPPLAIAAALGLCWAWDHLQQKALKIAGLVLLTLLAIQSGATLIALHPYEYIAYNPLAGNTKIATSRYEGDYWASSFKEAIALLEKTVAKETPPHPAPYRVAVCAEPFQGGIYLSPQFKMTEDWESADFFIAGTTMHCDAVLQGKILGKISRLGADLAVIKDRRALTGKARVAKPAPL